MTYSLTYTLTFDQDKKNGDECALVVSEVFPENGNTRMVNVLFGNEAQETYLKLMGAKPHQHEKEPFSRCHICGRRLNMEHDRFVKQIDKDGNEQVEYLYHEHCYNRRYNQ